MPQSANCQKQHVSSAPCLWHTSTVQINAPQCKPCHHCKMQHCQSSRQQAADTVKRCNTQSSSSSVT
jgi:hypothetical protein